MEAGFYVSLLSSCTGIPSLVWIEIIHLVEPGTFDSSGTTAPKRALRYAVGPMTDRSASRTERVFSGIVAARWWLVAGYALLLPWAIHLAAKVPSDTSISNLIVQEDQDFLDNETFQKVFPEPHHTLLLVPADEPLASEAVARARRVQARLAAVGGLSVYSAVDLHDRAASTSRNAAGFREFASGTRMLARQGLVGPDFLGIAVDFEAEGAASRDRILADIEAALAPLDASAPSEARIRKVGGPWVDAYLEAETARASLTYFPLFGAFLITVILVLYRSLRTLMAFLTTLGVCVALSVGLAYLAGFSFTIVSSLVPLTILVTATAALVYIQSRFTEHPGGDLHRHQIFTLANKFLATTASIFAAAIGFAALAVSGIRPIREMGLWVAAGLLVTWVVTFTLFPALQRILATPARRPGRRDRPGAPDRIIEALPLATYRWRWSVLSVCILMMGAGALALTGLPGRIEPMRLETDALAYIDRSTPLYQDTRRLEEAIGGLSVLQAWVTSPEGKILDPEILHGIESFARALESDPRVGSVAGPTTLLRWSSYITGQGDQLPDAPASWPPLAAQLDSLLLEEPAARGFVDVATLSHARLTVVHRGSGFRGVAQVKEFAGQAWGRAAEAHPALASCRLRVVGDGLVSARIAEHLVPTLTESFLLTAGIIFLAFLVIFRSGAARLMAMIPSVFAILVMFLVMRLTGIPLNIATILIASTVLGASENDQIHFFYHYQERKPGSSVEQALRHALRIAGRGIMFATLINCGGFMALSLSGLPPMRQFGIMSASAFVLSMLASLVALPAALWIFSGRRPDADREADRMTA